MDPQRNLKLFVGRCLDKLEEKEPGLAKKLMTSNGKLSTARLHQQIHASNLQCRSGTGSSEVNLWQLALSRGIQNLFNGNEWESFARVMDLHDSEPSSSNSSQIEAKLIGKGGFASVYRFKLGEYDFALKKIGHKKPISMRSQLREAKLLQLINHVCHHPIIPRLWDYWITDEKTYILSEYGGRSLRNIKTSWLQTHPLALFDIAEQLISGILELHRAEFLHRDIKPQNVLFQWLDQRIHLKLIDYGLTCAYDEYGKKGFAGTPTYLGPWMWRPRKTISLGAAIAADVWACLATLYAIITAGESPLYSKIKDTETWGAFCADSSDTKILRRLALVPTPYPVQCFSNWLIDNLNCLQNQLDFGELLAQLKGMQPRFQSCNPAEWLAQQEAKQRQSDHSSTLELSQFSFGQ